MQNEITMRYTTCVLFSHDKVVKTYLHYDGQRIVAISRSILSLTEAR